jgi:hypothetical protein
MTWWAFFKYSSVVVPLFCTLFDFSKNVYRNKFYEMSLDYLNENTVRFDSLFFL